MNYTPEQIAEFVGGKLVSSSNQLVGHVSTDSRSVQNSSNTVFFALVSEKRNGHNFIKQLVDRGIKTYVVSEKFPFPTQGLSVIEVANTLSALQLFATEHRKQFVIPVISITGSYGKTIIKEWLYQLLSPDYAICRSPKSFNSQIGVPLSILMLEKTHTLGIFEAGISEFGEMTKLESIIQPSLGVLTKMGEAHQDGFESFEQKIKEKKILFKHCLKIIEIPLKKPDYQFPFTDTTSIENCSLCIKVMEHLNYEKSIIQERINLLLSLPLRLEIIKGIHNSTIINDGYNIGFSSLVLSLENLIQQAGSFQKTLIISEIPETTFEDEKLFRLIESSGLDRVLVVGNQQLKKTGEKTIVDYYSTTEELINELPQYNFRDHFVLIKGSRKFRLERVAKALEEKNHRTQLELDLNQLSRNLEIYKKKINPTTKLMVMVKAFSYGAGSSEIARVLELEGVDYLGVAYADEGIVLRNAGVKIPIMVMNPEPGTFADLIKYNLEPEIYSLEELREFVEDLYVADKQDYPIHLKLETGMNRLGFLSNELPGLIQFLKSQSEVYVKTIFSHLSSADDLNEEEYTLNQLKKFTEYSEYIMSAFNYKIERHILNTAGIDNYNSYQFDMVRLGIGLYGINVGKKDSGIKPISSLKSIIIQTKRLLKGDSIGYGRKTRAEREMIIAMIPIGYSDGLRRSLGDRNFSFYLKGQKCDIVGNICMDVSMIDVTNLDAKVGDEVEIFGQYNSIEDIAKAMETIPYEVMTSISQRVKRVFFRD
jgi:Alr-MurF fusion protein